MTLWANGHYLWVHNGPGVQQGATYNSVGSQRGPHNCHGVKQGVGSQQRSYTGHGDIGMLKNNCYKCGKKGHFARNCRNKNSNFAHNTDSNVIDLPVVMNSCPTLSNACLCRKLGILKELANISTLRKLEGFLTKHFHMSLQPEEFSLD